MHRGDARELLRGMPAESVDCVVTDPPYQTISGGNGESATHKRPTGMLADNDGKMFEHNDVKFREYLHDLYRVLRDPGHIYLMVNFLNLEAALAEMRRAGFRVHNLLIARKQNATPNRWYMKNVEYTIFARKGAAFPINDCGSMTCHDWKNPVGNKTHPTEKSVDLMRMYVENSTQPGDIVLDPFAGTGSTGVACKLSGRSFVGCEFDVTYLTIACKRIGVMPCL
ncbi:site-specific DNA-methyltransferase [Sedimentitalea sp. JM2-8]|uniref:Methyltransferase n=1 Tax=Sedimentitalea xiamensis TaxID=3050037 RepID=A0ABT7FJR3_9RHOB|nr:site-specific DNA-methyltransferase [Sedimentitalea xiamensis]MDK3075168.1 site-specific DNA-methyltransferase [Sedimentitalea xiamensis]